MDKTRIQPVAGSHAIEVMAIGIEWGAPHLDASHLAALQTLYESNAFLKEALPQFLPIQAFTVQGAHPFPNADSGAQPDMQNFLPPTFTAESGGFDVRQVDSTGKPTWVVSIRPEFASVSCTDYDRWQNVKPQALALLLPFVKEALALGALINAAGLQYQDAFRLLDGASSQSTSALFRTDGFLLPTHLFNQRTFWHCHQGWFSEGLKGRRLLNSAAIEVSDVGGTHFARIGGQHRMFAVSFDASSPVPIVASEIDGILQRLHAENIAVVNGVLSDGALEAIGCTVEAL